MVTGVLGVLAFSAAYLARMSRPVFIKALVGALACLSAFTAPLQAQTNISAVGHLSYQQLRGSAIANLWGYVDELGNEYALVGVNGTEEQPGGLSVVDLSDPANPQEIFFLPGPASIWREVKVWNDHVYVTTEAEHGGLTIVDLSPLPQSTVLPSTVWIDDGWDSSHSLFIDEAGRLYIYGANEGNGEGSEVLYRGIAARSFERRFQLADHVRVLGARLVHGLLDVELAREVPEAMKPRKIEIGGGQAQPRVIDSKAA